MPPLYVRPWLKWFFEDASLPSSVFGPVESWALA